MAFVLGFKPGLGMKGFSLEVINFNVNQCVSIKSNVFYLLHVFEELLATPPLQFPIIVILFAATNA
jgi:hypothetical protein